MDSVRERYFNKRRAVYKGGVMLKPILFLSLIAAIYFCAGLAVNAQVANQPNTSTPAEKREAEKAWEALIRTQGGREKLQSVTNMLWEFSTETRLEIFPNRYWEFGHLLDKSPKMDVYDGPKNVQYAAIENGIVAINHDDLTDDFEQSQAQFLLETKWYKPELLRVTRIKEGKKQFDVIDHRRQKTNGFCI